MAVPIPSDEDEVRRHWPVILTCFCVAVFAWGFGFYGQAVSVAEVRRLHGWPAGLITGATTGFYLCGALLMPFIPGTLARFGPARVMAAGSVLMAVGAWWFATAPAPVWLFPAGAIMAAGWAATSGPAIAATMALWFDRRRGLALSLALNGASASGFIVAPLLVMLTGPLGIGLALLAVAVAGLLILVPLTLTTLRRPPGPAATAATARIQVPDPRPGFDTRARALRSRALWSVSLPFAMALLAQVGLIIHIVALLRPTLGAEGTSLAVGLVSVMAMAGRLVLGCVIDRLHLRATSAVSFAVQALGFALMALWPANAAALYLGCALFGASVGNVITLPALLIQREFAPKSYGLIVGLSGAIGQFTLAFGPVLFGILYDLTGGYAVVLATGIGLQVAGSILVLILAQPPRRNRSNAAKVASDT